MYCRDIKLPAGKVTSFGGKKDSSNLMHRGLSFKASPSGSAAESTPKRGARMSSTNKISPTDESVPSTDSSTSGTGNLAKKSPTRTSSVGLRGSAPSESNLTEDAPKGISRDRKASSISNLNAKQESGTPLLNAKQPSQKKLTDDRSRGSIVKRSSVGQ